jgi:twitching motility two-component system response regulator PilG
MSEKKHCLVGTFGLLEHEISLVQSIFRMSHSRKQVPYKLIQENIGKAHIIVAAVNDEATVDEWQKLVNQGHSSILVAVTPKEMGKFPGYSFSRPFSPTKLLDTLDKIMDKELSDLFSVQLFNGENTAKYKAFASSEKLVTKQYRALVVDDSKTAQAVLKRELTASNIQTDIAETGEQCLEMINKRSYDVIFLDVVLPGADGYQVCKKIKHDQQKKHIPVIMMSGNTSPFDKVRGKMSGCSTYLTKPVDYAKFYQALDQFVLKTAVK